MTRKIIVADLLCGAGGSSTGCLLALRDLGWSEDDIILACVNHWPTAIETHRLNHPRARHYVQDIASVRPHIVVPEGYLDLLMASPTCTHHSIARGGKPTSDQQRSDPWHIITWLTELRVARIIIENVWEFRDWGPVDERTGKPIKERKGEYFHAWIETIRRLGFEPEWRKLNAADYGDATTRQRFILMARSDGRKVRWPMPTHRRRGAADAPSAGLFAADLKPWKPAREIIDWSIKGRSIFHRKKPLAPKTLARIYAGAERHDWPEPYLVILRNHMAAQGIDAPVPTIAAKGQHIGIAEPVIVNMKGKSTATAAEEPLPTQTAHAAHLFTAEPVIVNGRRGNQAKPVSEAPVPTLDTKGGVWLAEPIMLSQHNSGAPRGVDEPLPTITTGGAGTEGRPGCARPMLVEPFILSQASGGAARSVNEPIPTQTTGGNGASHALITSYYGASEWSGDASDPLPTVTTKDRFGLVVPVTQSGGGATARDVREPITAKGGEFAIVMPVTHADGSARQRDAATEPLPTVTGANRGELAFITAQNFGEREGQAPRVHTVDDPAPTVTATGRVNLVQPDGETYDILFRMLEPHELAAAMGFGDEDSAYEFAGTKTQKVKQIGNAVSVAKMRACVRALMADAVPSVERQEAAE